MTFNSVCIPSVELALYLAGCFKVFWNRESDFLLLLLQFYVFIFSCLFFSFSVWLYLNILPPTVSVSPSLIQCRQLLLHSLLFSFIPSLPLCLSDPLKWDPIMFFPSCSPPTLAVRRWTPGRRYKGHDLQGLFANKKREKDRKNINERSVFQHSSLVGFTCQSFDLKYGTPATTQCGPILTSCRSAKMCFSQWKKNFLIKLVSVFLVFCWRVWIEWKGDPNRGGSGRNT